MNITIGMGTLFGIVALLSFIAHFVIGRDTQKIGADLRMVHGPPIHQENKETIITHLVGMTLISL